MRNTKKTWLIVMIVAIAGIPLLTVLAGGSAMGYPWNGWHTGMVICGALSLFAFIMANRAPK
jgi:hypothetical protein